MGGCFNIDYTGQNITTANLSSTNNYKNGSKTTITISKSSSCKIYTEANIYIHTNNTTTAPIDTVQALRYKIVSEDNVEYDGYISRFCDVLMATVPIEDISKTYTVYIWIDNSKSYGEYDGKSYSGYVYATSIQTSTIEKDDIPENYLNTDCPGITNIGFSYIGESQTFTVPKTGTYKIETWGAQGGDATRNSNTYIGGHGGYSIGTKNLSEGDILYINVGEKGGTANSINSTNVIDNNKGYNGGGPGVIYPSNGSSGGGGGATHIATKFGLLKDLSNNIEKIFIVAGGGGGAKSHNGAPKYSGNGGAGGGNNGIDGDATSNTCYNLGLGATQLSCGGHRVCSVDGKEYGSMSDIKPNEAAFGLGANYTNSTITNYYSYAGGGGGLYGGAAGFHAPGGGGSGYIGGVTNGNTIDGDSSMPTHDGEGTMIGNSGNGYAKITFIE